jgi:hypothetical protein
VTRALPEFVYFVTVDTEWPVSAFADDHAQSTLAERLEREVKRRSESANVFRPGLVHVWKARVTDVEEVELLPAATIQPQIRPREPAGNESGNGR